MCKNKKKRGVAVYRLHLFTHCACVKAGPAITRVMSDTQTLQHKTAVVHSKRKLAILAVRNWSYNNSLRCKHHTTTFPSVKQKKFILNYFTFTI